jgi:hypothetical protein
MLRTPNKVSWGNLAVTVFARLPVRSYGQAAPNLDRIPGLNNLIIYKPSPCTAIAIKPTHPS